MSISSPSPEMPTVVVRHDVAGSRFVTTVDGVDGVLDYQRRGDLMVLTHTGVPEAIGGRGIAGKLTLKAFEHARSEGLKVRPDCAYAAAWVKRHPEYRQLLA
ncbi:GNAT family N-acetyltransferase [Lysobacter sp. A289]